MIDEKLAVYIKALEANDAATAREEFIKYLKLNLYIPGKYLGQGIQMFVKNEAWSEGATVLQAGNAHSNDDQGGNSQNFLGKFVRFFVTLRCFYGVVHIKLALYDLYSG